MLCCLAVERKLREEQRALMVGRTIANRRGSAISAMTHHDADDSLSGTPEPSETSDYVGEEDHHRIPDHSNSSHDASLGYKIGPPRTPIDSATRNKLERRMSTSSAQSSKYRQRLGILRTVDLSGETIETYERRGSVHTVNTINSVTSAATVEYLQQQAADEPDDLKAAVVMETIITAADVAHNLQGWDHMVR